ncbi:hypothetical protein T4D_16201 [Trichinella pseudospiralis]|uniref:Uncharacterized protein n=1 Tax=Trichinella pseudospiralis TaxID=6337 RepID=A0A0V1DSC5_TRIPS|nr:hypothetical protein T4D_16201 [Trichinella pseudospiralis]
MEQARAVSACEEVSVDKLEKTRFAEVDREGFFITKTQ